MMTAGIRSVARGSKYLAVMLIKGVKPVMSDPGYRFDVT